MIWHGAGVNPGVFIPETSTENGQFRVFGSEMSVDPCVLTDAVPRTDTAAVLAPHAPGDVRVEAHLAGRRPRPRSVPGRMSSQVQGRDRAPQGVSPMQPLDPGFLCKNLE